jgi:hypothetical protein
VNTLKSAALVIVLLGVLYGVYVALNKPEPPLQAGPPATGENASPLIEYGGSDSPASQTTAAPPLARDYDNSPASTPRPIRGGAYQPDLDTGSLPPPTTVPAGGPAFGPAAAVTSGLQRSGYESDAGPTADSSAPGSSSPAPPREPVSPAAVAARDAAPALAAYDLRRDLLEAEQLANGGKCRAALAKLTPHYANADLASDQRAVLMSWLDALAAKVIYSREHCLAAAHQVRKGETLYDIAHQYNVEYRLLQNINRADITDPLILVPSTELKVIPGPFHADVNLTSGEITLLLNDLYAGRFPFTLGDQPPQPAECKVVDKRSQQKTYVGLDGRMIPANDPNNPYGGWWICLGGEVAIHGSPASPADKTLGCISLSPQDAADIYGILSIGSEVKIRR